MVGSGSACTRDTPKIPPCSAAAWLQTGSSQVVLGTASLPQGALLAFWTTGLLRVNDSCVSNNTEKQIKSPSEQCSLAGPGNTRDVNTAAEASRQAGTLLIIDDAYK